MFSIAGTQVSITGMPTDWRFWFEWRRPRNRPYKRSATQSGMASGIPTTATTAGTNFTLQRRRLDSMRMSRGTGRSATRLHANMWAASSPQPVGPLSA